MEMHLGNTRDSSPDTMAMYENTPEEAPTGMKKTPR